MSLLLLFGVSGLILEPAGPKTKWQADEPEAKWANDEPGAKWKARDPQE